MNMIYNNSCKSVLTTIRCPNKEQANAEEKQHLPFFKFSTKKSNIAYSPFFKFCLTPLFLVASKPQPHYCCHVSLTQWMIVPHLM